jgi:hypothetical protein
MTMNKHPMTRTIFTEHLVRDFGCPVLHILDFGRLKIVIHWHTKLIGNRCVEGYLFRTVEDSLDALRSEPVPVLGGINIA